MCVISLCGYDVTGYLYGSYPYLGMMLSELRFDWWTSLRKQFGCVGFCAVQRLGSLSNGDGDGDGNEKGREKQ